MNDSNQSVTIPLIIAAGVIVALGIVGGAVWLLMPGRPVASPVLSQPSDTQDAPSIPSENLFADYEANPFHADERYKDKIVQVRGQVSLIAKDADGLPLVYLAGLEEPNLGMAACRFPSTEVSKVAALSVDQFATIKGKCIGKTALGKVTLTDCMILKVDKPTAAAK